MIPSQRNRASSQAGEGACHATAVRTGAIPRRRPVHWTFGTLSDRLPPPHGRQFRFPLDFLRARRSPVAYRVRKSGGWGRVSTTDAQVRRLMAEMTKYGRIGLAAMLEPARSEDLRASTRRASDLPSQLVEPRDWRTREVCVRRALASRKVEALLSKVARHARSKDAVRASGGEVPAALRRGATPDALQRRVKTWRAEHGPDKDVMLAGSSTRPGEAAQTDFHMGDRARE